MALLETLSAFFLDPGKWWLFLLLIPFILLYLIKPKPRYQMMPTLMFLFRDMGKNRKTNMLRRLITNLLFLLQIILLLSILIAANKPFVDVSKEFLFKNTVIVLDVSASMQARHEGGTRFDAAIDEARKSLGSINTLVLAKRVPQAALVDESAGKVKDYLNKLEPTDNPTNLYSALTAAGAYAKADSRIVVISDFLDTETDADLGTIRKTLEAQDIKVDFVSIFSKVPNVGIVDVQITEAKTTAVIKNFNADPVEAKLKINDLEETLQIPANSKELFTFATPPRTSKLELIVPNDGFAPDNEAYVSAPSDTPKKILFITNNPNYAKTYIYNALDVMRNTEITIAAPPKIPDMRGYDVYVFKDMAGSLILPGTFREAREEVEKGKAVIITGSNGLENMDLQGLIPGKARFESVTTNILPAGAQTLTENIEFGATKQYYVPGPGPIPIASTDNGTAIITYATIGQGKVVFYGIPDERKEADVGFGKSPVYFVFWKRTLDLITNTPNVKNLNYKTGSTLPLGESQSIQTPRGRITTDSLALDDAGLYTLRDRTIAINIMDERESDISKEADLTTKLSAEASQRFAEKVPYELTTYFLWAAVIALFLELLYVKARGDF